jgi:ubiquinone/menaquinone biosynthesis C-methylase UbiE
VVASEAQPGRWQSYDSVVDAYESAAVPRFKAVARDLVAAVAPAPGGSVLDVGTGTGIAGQLAFEATGQDAFAVGIDPSLPMLTRAGARGLTVVAGSFPELPFADDVFDAVLANLVLSHLGDYARAVVEATRVLRPGGRFGFTAWGSVVAASADHQGPEADEIVQAILVAHGLDVAPSAPPVPSEDALRDRKNVENALREAGLVDVHLQSRTYHWAYSVDDYLVGRDWRPGIRYIREQADPRLWQDIRKRASSDLYSRFHDEIHTMGHLWIAVGTKP